jgi:hypothetical protein
MGFFDFMVNGCEEIKKPNVAADEQRSAAENLFDDAVCLLQPLVRPPAGGQADARSAATFTRAKGAQRL